MAHPKFFHSVCCIIILMTSAAASVGSTAVPAGDHPHCLNALPDLRAARWLLEHHPVGWHRGEDEAGAENEIDAGIAEIKKSGIDDHKNLGDHPALIDKPDRQARLQEVMDFLRKAQKEVEGDEDKGLKGRVLRCINEAIRLSGKAISGKGN